MSLNDFVVDALVHTPSYQNARLWTVENHEKYSTCSSLTPGLTVSSISITRYFCSCEP